VGLKRILSVSGGSIAAWILESLNKNKLNFNHQKYFNLFDEIDENLETFSPDLPLTITNQRSRAKRNDARMELAMINPLCHFGKLTTSVCLLISVSAGAAQVSPKTLSQTRAQYQAAADQAVKNPFRVDIQPSQQGIKQGSDAILRIQLRNGNNEVVNATEKMTFEIKTKLPSGKEQVRKVDIPAGSNTAETTVKVDEAGLSKLEVRESGDRLIPGSSYLVVSPPEKKELRRPPQGTRPSSSSKSKATPSADSTLAPRLVLAAYTPLNLQNNSGDPVVSQPGGPTIILTVSGEGDGKVRADGVSAARVSAFLLSPQPVDTNIWLEVSQGKLESTLLVIKKGELEADVNWTSTTPSDAAKVWIKTTSPKTKGNRSAVATVQFSDPIVAIVFANPPSKLNIVERAMISVRFIDRTGVPVSATAPIHFTFNINSPHAHLNPVSDQTKPGDPDFSTSITPAALGAFTVEAAVPGYKPISQSIEVTGFLLLGLCALGGALGGLVNHYDLRQKGLLVSLVTGMIVALPITWAYVWLGLPNINTAIFHNQLSAVMVAIIAGMSGATGLKKIATITGFKLFEEKPVKNAASA